MRCRKPLSTAGVEETLTKAALARIRAHQDMLLLQEEKRKLEGTKPLVAAREGLRARKESVRALRAEVRDLRDSLRGARRNLRNQERALQRCADDADIGRFVSDAQPSAWRCAADRCDLRVTEIGYCMGCAKVTTCMHCLGPIRENEDHICDPEMMNNTTTVRATTRACPVCAVPTEKASGCDQMWCTRCQTAWSWSTGRRIPTQHGFHNPHFAEYRAAAAATGRAEAGACQDAAARWIEASDVMTATWRKHAFWVSVALECNGAVALLRRVVNDLDGSALRHDARLTLLRVQHLEGDVDEGQWMRSLSRLARKRERCRELHQLYVTAHDASHDVLEKVVLDADNLEMHVHEMLHVFMLLNQGLRDAGCDRLCMTPKVVGPDGSPYARHTVAGGDIALADLAGVVKLLAAMSPLLGEAQSATAALPPRPPRPPLRLAMGRRRIVEHGPEAPFYVYLHLPILPDL